MTITITAFERSPDGGKGLARDTRVRWALEEVGQPYEVRLVSFRAMKEPVRRGLEVAIRVFLQFMLGDSDVDSKFANPAFGLDFILNGTAGDRNSNASTTGKRVRNVLTSAYRSSKGLKAVSQGP